MNAPVSRRFFVQHLSATVAQGSERKVNDWLAKSGFELGGTSQSLCGGARLRGDLKGLVLDVEGSSGKLTVKVDGTREIDIATGRVQIGEKGEKDIVSVQLAGSGAVQMFRLRCKEVITRPEVVSGGSTPPLNEDLGDLLGRYSGHTSSAPCPRKRKRKAVGRQPLHPEPVSGADGNGKPSVPGVSAVTPVVIGQTIISIPVDRIRPNPEQPRKVFHHARLEALGKSLRQDGQRIPIQVIQVVGDSNADFELVVGERRWRAAKLVGITHLNAVVLNRDEVPGRRKQHKLCMIVDFNQEGYSPLEVAIALFEERQAGTTVEELCSICGRSVAWVYQHLALNDLDEDFRQMLLLPKRQRMSFGIACRLAKFPRGRQADIWRQVSMEKGSRLQLIKIQELGAEEGRPGAKGRPRRASDYAANLAQHIIPRLAGDALTASRYPEDGFASLVQHSDPELVGALSRNLDTAIEGLNDLRRKFDEALKRKEINP